MTDPLALGYEPFYVTTNNRHDEYPITDISENWYETLEAPFVSKTFLDIQKPPSLKNPTIRAGRFSRHPEDATDAVRNYLRSLSRKTSGRPGKKKPGRMHFLE